MSKKQNAELYKSQLETYAGFLKISKYAIIGLAVMCILMWFFLVA